MFKQRCALSLLVVAVASAMTHGSTLSIRIDRLPQLDGTTIFELGVLDLVRLPNGETNASANRPHFTFGSFSALKEAIVGEWTIEKEMTPISPRELFTFELFDFPESALAIAPPSIVAPLDGATVPPVFTLRWAWPLGITPQNSKAVWIEKLGPGDRSGGHGHAHAPSTDMTEQINAEYSSGGLPERLVLRAGSYHPGLLGEYFSDVIPLQEPSSNVYSIRTYFTSYSLPVQVFVGVPEPGVIELLAIGVMMVAMSLRYRT